MSGNGKKIFLVEIEAIRNFYDIMKYSSYKMIRPRITQGVPLCKGQTLFKWFMVQKEGKIKNNIFTENSFFLQLLNWPV